MQPDQELKTSPTSSSKITAYDILTMAGAEMKDRAAQRDIDKIDPSSVGERSMAKTVAIFNAIVGKGLTEEEGWKFMICLKLARAQQGAINNVYKLDDYVDLAAYSSLLGETVVK